MTSVLSISRLCRSCSALLLFCAALLQGAEIANNPVLSCSTNQVGKYQKLEFSLTISADYTNPFDPDEVDLKVRFSTPSGRTLEVPAFWYQPYERKRVNGRDWMYPGKPAHWLARFAPAETGVYQAVAVLRAAGATNQSPPVPFRCLPSESRGFVRISGKDPRFLEFSEGPPFFPIGQNLAFIGHQQYVTLSKAEQIFSKLHENGANYLRTWTCCEDWAMAIEARKSAFGRSWDWRPPLVPLPGEERSGRKCLKLSREKNAVRIDPSHPVALRPDTSYLFRGRARLGRGVDLQIDGNGKQSPVLRGDAPGDEWRAFQLEVRTKPGESWLQPLTVRADGQGEAWVRDLSLREVGGGPELLWEADLNRPTRGYYNPLDSFMLDEVVAAAEQNGILLQLCYLTRDLYMNALKDPASPEYDRAIADAQRSLRYAIARWGFSTSVAAWEYWNEMNPGLPTDRFYSAMGNYLEQADPYRHLRTTSTWGPSPKDCRHAQIDVADVHFYLRPSDQGRLEDEVDAVLERTRWLREQAPNKPVHLGEFGLANEKWQPTEEMNRSREIVDFHNALWASALSGASGTALYWWWDRLDQRDHYAQYRPLARFVSDIPWTSGEVRAADATCQDVRLRTVGLQTSNRAWIWLFDRAGSWNRTVLQKKAPSEMSGAVVRVNGLAPGTYQIQWQDTRDSLIVGRQTGAVQEGILSAHSPAFLRDIACTIVRAN